MDNLIQIYSNGSISVLGIPLGVSVDHARVQLRNSLNEYIIKENRNCIYVEDLIVNKKFPSLIISYSKDERSRISEIHLRSSRHEPEYKIKNAFNFFNEKLKDIPVRNRKKDKSVTETTYYNPLLLINIYHQHVPQLQAQTGAVTVPQCVSLRIQGTLMMAGDDLEKVRNIAARQYYFHTETDTEPRTTKKRNNTPQKTRGASILMIIVVAFLIFLLILNGRYCRTGTDNALMFDKWKKEWIAPENVRYIAP